MLAFVIIFFLGFVLPLLPLSAPGEGEHTGYITSTERVNAMWVFPNLIAYVKTDLESSQEDAYCVQDAELLNQLRLAQQEQRRVTVSYRNGIWMPVWQCAFGQSIIRSVK